MLAREVIDPKRATTAAVAPPVLTVAADVRVSVGVVPNGSVKIRSSIWPTVVEAVMTLISTRNQEPTGKLVVDVATVALLASRAILPPVVSCAWTMTVEPVPVLSCMIVLLPPLVIWLTLKQQEEALPAAVAA